MIEGTRIMIPKPPRKRATAYEKQKARKRFRRRAGIEPVIGHLKSDYRLGRNFLKGIAGDNVNLMMAAAAFNFKKWIRQLFHFLFSIFRRFFQSQNENQTQPQCQIRLGYVSLTNVKSRYQY